MVKTFFKVASFLLLLQGCMSVKIEFFEKQNYTNPLTQLRIADHDDTACVTLPNEVLVQSIKTDKCVIAYVGENCVVEEVKRTPISKVDQSIRIDESEPKLIRHFDKQLGFFDDKSLVAIRSFHVCSQEIGGGPKLDLDIYGTKNYAGGIVASFQKVCGCTNLPRNFPALGKTVPFSINNHGNAVEFFEDENCHGQSRVVGAGFNRITSRMWPKKWAHDDSVFDIKSFRPIGLECE